MNPCQHMVIAKDKIITQEIDSCTYNQTTHKYDVRFKTGKVYSYNYDHIVWIKNPQKLSPANYTIKHNQNLLLDIKEIYVFKDENREFWHLIINDDDQHSYAKEDLVITGNCLPNPKNATVFGYLQEVAAANSLQSDAGTKLLQKHYEKLNFVPNYTAFASYLNPVDFPAQKHKALFPIFPFVCNDSQLMAVRNALINQISVIQGPPGTGKTQTILNIVANLIVAGKTVQVVSNNNSAIENIYRKLSSPPHDFSFMVAFLGNSVNKSNFINQQKDRYPQELQAWDMAPLSQAEYLPNLKKRCLELREIFKKQNQLATLNQLVIELDTEFSHFQNYVNESIQTSLPPKRRKNHRSHKILQAWHRGQGFLDMGKPFSFLFKLQCRFGFGVGNWGMFTQEPATVITELQSQFYQAKRAELESEKSTITEFLTKQNQAGLMQELSDLSMRYFQAKLKDRFGKTAERRVFTETDMGKYCQDFQKEYPVILSTTFSARSSLSASAEFDYLIIDEASQVDIATGALALSCANNAVIIGDSQQLPNVVTRDDKTELQAIFKKYSINQSYNAAENSLLNSICALFPAIPNTLLREHYRCHPKIANFFNRKFYGGHLKILSADNGVEQVITLVKTAPGNHARDHLNQRQVDIIQQELLPNLPYSPEEIGIIAPYDNQVDAIRQALPESEIEIATVHKFQGREKDAIIISTVDDVVTKFSDDPNLLNVAVSRAKKSLHLIVSANPQAPNGNIADLIDYIEYNNFTVTDSAIYSVFDFLYKHYSESRLKYLRKRRKVSEFDSENLMFALITEVLEQNNLTGLGLICHQPLRMLIRNFRLLDEAELRYAKHNATHVDFLIFNRVSKKPVLAIEVDGYQYHKQGTTQAARDQIKDRILEKYGIPLSRFATNGSYEREKLTSKLKEILRLNG